MREKGNISAKEYATQSKAMLGTLIRETYKQFEGTRVNYNNRELWDENVATKLKDAVTDAFGKQIIPEYYKVLKEFQRVGSGSVSRGLDETEKRNTLTQYERQAALDRYASATGRYARESPGAPINPLAATKADQVAPVTEMLKVLQQLEAAAKAQAAQAPRGLTPAIAQGQTKATVDLTEQLKVGNEAWRNTAKALVELPEMLSNAMGNKLQLFSRGNDAAQGQSRDVRIDVTQNITLKEDMEDVGAWADAFKRALGMAGLTAGIGNAS
jgi:hypothetical protein